MGQHLFDDGASIVAAGLRDNRTVRELSLAANRLGARGAEALLAALRGHPALEILDLGSTPSAKKLGAPANAIDSGALEALVAFVETLAVLAQFSPPPADRKHVLAIRSSAR